MDQRRIIPSGSGRPLRLTLPDPGFIAQLLAEPHEADATTAGHAFGLQSYRLQIGSRISYSGPVRPIDLRV